jgi:hypothetical protein
MNNNRQDNKVILLLVLVEDLVDFQVLKDFKINLDNKAEVDKEDNSSETFLMSLKSFSEEVSNLVKEVAKGLQKAKILFSNVK